MLIDTDLKTIDRAVPLPNTHDTMGSGAVSAKGTNSTTYITPGTNLSLIAAGKNGQFTLVQTGTVTTSGVTVPFTGTGQVNQSRVLVAQLPHNLSYTPGVYAFLVSNGVYLPLPYTQIAGFAQTGTWLTLSVTTDDTNINFYADCMCLGQGETTGAGLVIRYYLIQQTPN
jgi:hypothetical protein